MIFFKKVGKYITICQLLHKWQDLALQRHLVTAEQRRRITSLDLLAVLPFIQPRMLFVFCAIKTHCCLIFKMVVHQDLHIFFSKAAFYPVGHLRLLVHGVIPHQRQDFSYPCMRFFLVLQPVQLSLNGSIFVWYINHSSQFRTICKFAEGTLSPIIQVINKEVEWYWPICGLPLNWFSAADHNPLGPLVQPVFNTPCCPLI